jgi:hypothetical protein
MLAKDLVYIRPNREIPLPSLLVEILKMGQHNKTQGIFKSAPPTGMISNLAAFVGSSEMSNLMTSRGYKCISTFEVKIGCFGP